MALPQLPPPDAPVLHIHSHTSGQIGPISRRDLRQRLADGQIAPQSHVWMDGMNGWEGLEQHQDALVSGLDPEAPQADPPDDDGSSTRVEAAPAVAEPALASVDPAESASADGATTEIVAASTPPGARDAVGADIASSAPEGQAGEGLEDAGAEAPAADPPVEPAPVADAAEAPPAEEARAADDGVADAGDAGAVDVEPVQVAQAGESDDDFQDRVFGDLVRQSWAYLGDHRFASHVDEIFVGAVITSTLDTGYSLIDLTSDGTHHYLRFENLGDRTRIIVRLTHLTASLAVSKILGQRMSAIIGYGERVGNIGKIWSALKAEMKSSYIQDAEPGTITVDGDVASGYVYCQVDLYLDIDDYVSRDYTIDYDRLSTHIGAVTHALRRYLRGRFA
jgi:hypothetical protein